MSNESSKKPASMYLRFALVLVTVGLIARAVPATADDVGITSARLLERADGSYTLEADIPPMLVSALRPPVVPERFQVAPRPEYRRIGMGLIVRYEFGGSDTPLQREDVLLLPWARSAVLLTARWSDGQVDRAMFPRGPAGIKIPISILRPTEPSALVAAREHSGSGLDETAERALRIILLLSIVAAVPGWSALRLVLMLAGGHAISMVLLDIGFPELPPALALAGLGLGAALVSRAALRGDHQALWPLLLTLGVVDGLGLGTAVRSSTADEGTFIPALFGAMVGIDVAQFVFAAAVIAVARMIHNRRLTRALAAAAGSLAVAATIVVMVGGLRATESAADPTASLARARFDFGTPSTTSSGSVAPAAAPRSLEDPAMVFLNVEPTEVRLEVLLGLRDFVKPLQINGAPGDIVPIAVQDSISARAKQMVIDTVDVTIDGRDAVPLLERTDFVTVAATGVATRTAPEAEPLDTAVLGVTLAYGVDRPPATVEVNWHVYPASDTQVSAIWTDPTGSERVTLSRTNPTLVWANDLTGYGGPSVREIKVQPLRWPFASVLLAVCAGLIWFVSKTRPQLRFMAPVCLAASAVLYPFVRSAVAFPGTGAWALEESEMGEVVEGLLANVYRSFELRDEGAIYDQLAISVAGDQLTRVYLENRSALELENRGGARARVDEVEVLEVPSVDSDGRGGFRVVAQWAVSGSVNHFGHVHYRQNQYDAELHLIAIDGVWKIQNIEILDERRVL